MSESSAQSFQKRPYATLTALAVPLLLTLVAEPLAGLADTAFVKELGASSLGGVGIGAAVLSGILWMLNFLSVSTHTQVAQAEGAGQRRDSQQVFSLAMTFAAVAGTALAALLFAFAEDAVVWMGAEGALRGEAVVYLRVRVLATPFWLVTLVGFGALRGLQLMRAQVVIAVLINVLNVALDPLFIFGSGPLPAMGVAGAAWATVLSQVIGSVLSVFYVFRTMGWAMPSSRHVSALLVVGRDMFVRTGLLTGFLVAGTRVAASLGDDSAAAHQAIRQSWFFCAYLLDSFALAAQSLVGYFWGAGQVELARRASWATLRLNTAVGVAMTIALWLGQYAILAMFVPATAHSVFVVAWLPTFLFMIPSSASFATDGIHMGVGDFAFLRNAMIAATGLMLVALTLVESLAAIWWVTGLWVSVRAVLGVLRVRSGPLRKKTAHLFANER